MMVEKKIEKKEFMVTNYRIRYKNRSAMLGVLKKFLPQYYLF
jgi:hypothetical protein